MTFLEEILLKSYLESCFSSLKVVNQEAITQSLRRRADSPIMEIIQLDQKITELVKRATKV